MAVVGRNATLLQEVPLFTSLEPVNNIMLHQVGHYHVPYFSSAIQCYIVPLNIQHLVCRVRLWLAALCLWLKSKLKAALCIPAATCVPEPEAWAVSGPMVPAGTQQQSEYKGNI